MIIFGKVSGFEISPEEPPELKRTDSGKRLLPPYLLIMTRVESAPWFVYVHAFRYKIQGRLGGYESLFKIHTAESTARELDSDLDKLPMVVLPDDVIDRSGFFDDAGREEGTDRGVES